MKILKKINKREQEWDKKCYMGNVKIVTYCEHPQIHKVGQKYIVLFFYVSIPSYKLYERTFILDGSFVVTNLRNRDGVIAFCLLKEYSDFQLLKYQMLLFTAYSFGHTIIYSVNLGLFWVLRRHQ